MCWTARYQDTARRSWEIYPIGFLVPWSASCSDKNPRCNELQLGMVHELLVQGLCCNFWYRMEGEGLWKFFLTFDGGINRFLLCTCMVSMFSAIPACDSILPSWFDFVAFGSWNSSRFWWCKWSLPKSWWRSQAGSVSFAYAWNLYLIHKLLFVLVRNVSQSGGQGKLFYEEKKQQYNHQSSCLGGLVDSGAPQIWGPWLFPKSSNWCMDHVEPLLEDL